MERLRALLDPIDGPERSIVTWLGGWDDITPTIIGDMAERAIATATASGYDKGFAEGTQHEREQTAAAYQKGYAAGRRDAAADTAYAELQRDEKGDEQ